MPTLTRLIRNRRRFKNSLYTARKRLVFVIKDNVCLPNLWQNSSSVQLANGLILILATGKTTIVAVLAD